jgi:hypothetical protein
MPSRPRPCWATTLPVRTMPRARARRIRWWRNRGRVASAQRAAASVAFCSQRTALSEAWASRRNAVRQRGWRSGALARPRDDNWLSPCDLLHGTGDRPSRTLTPSRRLAWEGCAVILTAVGYLLLVLSVLAVCLFCWLSYASLTSAARPPQRPAQDQFLERAVRDITRPIGFGSG